jgi:tellurite resistance protein TerC
MDYLTSAWMWIGFSVFLIIALSIDTLVIGKYRARSKETWRAALYWTLFWVALSLLFNILLWVFLRQVEEPQIANELALNFLTAYLVEKSLSLDNLFVFYLVFQHFQVPVNLQHRVLTYGIWGAVILRLIFIVMGIWLISMFHWLLYVMGAFLCYTGLKIMFMEEKDQDLADTMIIKYSKKFFRVTHEFSGEQFFVRKHKLLYATPLFIALIVVELSDLVFAVDSIPAVLSIVRNPFIVWSSNIFAILGLRAMYFLLARMVEQLVLLKYGVALILIFVGVKMLIEHWLVIPSSISLCIIAVVIIVFTLLSLQYTKQQE